MCSLHGAGPVRGFIPWIAPVPRWQGRGHGDDLCVKEKRSCTPRLRSRSRAKYQKLDSSPLAVTQHSKSLDPTTPSWKEAARRRVVRSLPEDVDCLAKPADQVRDPRLPRDVSATARERWLASLVVPSLRDARVWPVQDEDLDQRCLFNGYQGSVYDVELQGSDGRWRPSVMKLPPFSKPCLKDFVQPESTAKMPSTAERDQLWLCIPCKDDGAYFHLCNRSSGMQVLEIRGGGPGHSAASLRLSEYSGGDRQKWKVDDDSRITSKLDCMPGDQAIPLKFCIDVVGAQDANSAAVCAYAANGGRNQQWELEVVGQAGRTRLVRIVSQMDGRRLLTVENGDEMRKDMILEIEYLARWYGEAGLVQLQKVVWNNGVPQAIVEERLGKQLGRGTGDAEKACILQDIRHGLVHYTPQRAASSLLPVANVLRRIHSDGYVYNDMHDGNILRHMNNDSYKLIDLGSVTRADHWLSEIGSLYDCRWSRNRDWRAFALAFLGLILNGRQLDVWVLVGTNSCIKASSGLECSWSSPSDQVAWIPQDVEDLLTEHRGLWAVSEERGIRQVLLALFAPCVDDRVVCQKLWALSLSTF